MLRSTALGLFLLGATIICPAAELDPALAERLEEAFTRERLPVIVLFADQVSHAEYGRSGKSARELIVDLKSTASASEAAFRPFLKVRGKTDNELAFFWISNCVCLEADTTLIKDMLDHPAVARIEWDSGGAGDGAPDRQPPYQWNIDIVNAPQVWANPGLTGSGVDVGVMDTGMAITHVALAGKWRGGSNSWYDFYSSATTPYDDHNHGSHVTGTICGGDGLGPFGEDIGVAYNARIVVAKVLDQNNSFASATAPLSGAQFMLDPDNNPTTNDFPRVISNSWYFFSQTTTAFYNAAAAWRAAGIIPVFCMGNEGPAGSTTRPPANHNNVIGVGATSSIDGIASFSSRGPAPAGSSFPADGKKPDFSAPGVSVRSSTANGGYASYNGTSMATPHIAAAIALMMEADPDITYNEVYLLLQNSSKDLGTAGFDFDYGYGRLDVEKALGQTPDPSTSWVFQ